MLAVRECLKKGVTELEILSRDQLAVYEFVQASCTLRAMVNDGFSKSLPEMTNSLLQAISSFGLSELYARQSERYRVIGQDSDSQHKKVAFHNQKGILSLGLAKKSLKQLRAEAARFPTGVLLPDDFRGLQDELLEHIAELEVKPSDVEKLIKVVRESLGSLQGQGAVGWMDYLESRLDELEKIRTRPDRGAVDNIPVWKIAAIAVAIGVWVWALFKCRWWGSCSYREGLAYAIVFWLAALVSRYC